MPRDLWSRGEERVAGIGPATTKLSNLVLYQLSYTRSLFGKQRE